MTKLDVGVSPSSQLTYLCIRHDNQIANVYIMGYVGLILTRIVTRFDPRYRPASRSCINLHATIVIWLLTISSILIKNLELRKNHFINIRSNIGSVAQLR